MRNKSSEALSRRLEQIPAEILVALRPALVQGAEDVASNMRALVPVDEGDLKASIAVTGPGGTTPAYAQGGASVTAGVNQALVTVGNPEVRTGHIVEFGSVKMDARPFMRPSFRLAKRKVENRITRAISKAIKAMGGA